MSFSSFKRPVPPPRKETQWPVGFKFAPAPRCDGPASGQPKREYIRSKAILAACRELPCQHCGRDERGRVCAAHSNWGIHGKGGHIKADDNRVAALCDLCHVPILDQGSQLSKAERQEMWWKAHCKTVRELVRFGLWPNNVPIPDIRSFQA